MSNEWDAYAGEWDDNPQARDYADRAFGELIKIVETKGARILDFGCGTGLLTERLLPHADIIVALDSSAKMVERLKQKNLLNVFTIADVLSDDLISTCKLLHRKFDLITASSVCAFLPDYEAMLFTLRSLLAPNGKFVQWDWLSTSKDAGVGLTEERVSQALSKSGFTDIALSQPFSIENSEKKTPVLMAAASRL